MASLPQFVIKRNGEKVLFDLNKISWAIKRCLRSKNEDTDNKLLCILNIVKLKLLDKNCEIIGVEEIQDIVQYSIYEFGLDECSFEYIFYRDRKSKMRENRPIPEEVKQAFEESSKYFANPIQQFQFYDKYSRFNYETGTRETWVQTVKRTVEFLKYLSKNKLKNSEYENIEEYILNQKSMPSMRLLATAGKAAERNNIALYNCAFLSINSIEAIVEVMTIGMAGCGIGYSVEREYVNQLPVVKHQLGIKSPTFFVKDSSEGWSEALLIALETWFNGYDIDFDYSLLRPSGAILLTKGGRASGYAPLARLLNFIKKRILAKQGQQLSSLDVHDIICQIADATVSGGHRRVALISLFDFDDLEMRSCKDGDFATENSQRWNANNSSVIPEDGITYEELFSQMMDMFAGERGEPGLVSRKAIKATIPIRRKYQKGIGSNPCFRKGTLIHTKTGNFPIETLIGKEVEIWDGNQWLKINNFRVTARNQKILRIGLFVDPCLGSQDIYVTPYHTLILEDGRRVTAEELNNNYDKYVAPDANFVALKTTISPRFDTNNGYCEECDTSWNEIHSITEMPGIEEEVYCCTVPTTHSLTLANGIHVGNCGEIYLRNMQFCNLSQAIVREDDTEETLMEKVRIATLIGTIQSMGTDFKGLRSQWKENCEEERLLGVDLNGFLDNPITRDAHLLARLKQYAIETNKYYAQILGINPSTAITCMKPAGNSSVLLNCSSGLHPRWSPYYIRNVRVNKNTPMYKVLYDAGVSLSPENGQTRENATMYVVSFPVKSPSNAIFRKDLSFKDHADIWLMCKKNWTEHNPSVTLTYKEHEKQEVIDWTWNSMDYIGGVSFLPSSDAKYDQMPYIEITEEEYNKRIAEFPSIDYSKLYQYEVEDFTTASMELACSGANGCEVK